jgi:hypothetical protein
MGAGRVLHRVAVGEAGRGGVRHVARGSLVAAELRRGDAVMVQPLPRDVRHRRVVSGTRNQSRALDIRRRDRGRALRARQGDRAVLRGGRAAVPRLPGARRCTSRNAWRWPSQPRLCRIRVGRAAGVHRRALVRRATPAPWRRGGAVRRAGRAPGGTAHSERVVAAGGWERREIRRSRKNHPAFRGGCDVARRPVPHSLRTHWSTRRLDERTVRRADAALQCRRVSRFAARHDARAGAVCAARRAGVSRPWTNRQNGDVIAGAGAPAGTAGERGEWRIVSDGLVCGAEPVSCPRHRWCGDARAR